MVDLMGWKLVETKASHMAVMMVCRLGKMKEIMLVAVRESRLAASWVE